MLTIKEAAKKILRSEVRVRQLVAQGRILGARKHGPVWAIPAPVVVLPPKPRLHHCVWRSCRHNVDIGSGRRRCAAGRSGFWGTACPQYEARADVPEWARPAWARTEAAKRD